MALIQVRVDDELKVKASRIYKKLGLDLSSAIRMFLTRTIEDNGVPFPMRLEKKHYDPETALNLLAEFQRISKLNGNSEMTLNDIEEEIKQTRLERKNKK